MDKWINGRTHKKTKKEIKTTFFTNFPRATSPWPWPPKFTTAPHTGIISKSPHLRMNAPRCSLNKGGAKVHGAIEKTPTLPTLFSIDGRIHPSAGRKKCRNRTESISNGISGELARRRGVARWSSTLHTVSASRAAKDVAGRETERRRRAECDRARGGHRLRLRLRTESSSPLLLGKALLLLRRLSSSREHWCTQRCYPRPWRPSRTTNTGSRTLGGTWRFMRSRGLSGCATTRL
jgi:hypothetical protein